MDFVLCWVGVVTSVVKEFGANSELKMLYLVYFAIVIVGGFLWWMVPVVVFAVFCSNSHCCRGYFILDS